MPDRRCRRKPAAVLRVGRDAGFATIIAVTVAVAPAGLARRLTSSVDAILEDVLPRRQGATDPASSAVLRVRREIVAVADLDDLRAALAHGAPTERRSLRAVAHREVCEPSAQTARHAVLALHPAATAVFVVQKAGLAAVVGDAVTVGEEPGALQGPALAVVTAEVTVRRHLDGPAAIARTGVAARAAVLVIVGRIDAREVGRHPAVELARLAPARNLLSFEHDASRACGTFISASSAIVIAESGRLTTVVRDAVAVERVTQNATQHAAPLGAVERATAVFRRALVPTFSAVVHIREEIDVTEEFRRGTGRVARGTPVRGAIQRRSGLRVAARILRAREFRRCLAVIEVPSNNPVLRA